MKESKFSDAQKAFILKQGEEGTSVAEICRGDLSQSRDQPGDVSGGAKTDHGSGGMIPLPAE